MKRPISDCNFRHGRIDKANPWRKLPSFEKRQLLKLRSIVAKSKRGVNLVMASGSRLWPSGFLPFLLCRHLRPERHNKAVLSDEAALVVLRAVSSGAERAVKLCRLRSLRMLNINGNPSFD